MATWKRRQPVCVHLWIKRFTLIAFCLLYLSLVSGREERDWIKNGLKGPGRINLGKHGKGEDLSKLFTKDGYYIDTDTQQEPVSARTFSGIIIQSEAQKLSANLRWLSNEEIGITSMQAIYDSLPYTDRQPNHKAKLKKISQKLEGRFKNYLQLVKTNKMTVQYLYNYHMQHPITHRLDCCSLNSSQFRSDSQYRCPISRQTSCDLLPFRLSPKTFNPGRNLTEVWKGNMEFFPTLKWQYFISADGVHNEYPSSSFQWSDCQSVHDTRHRDVFVSTIQPQSKHVVIIMDHGNSLSDAQLHTAKSVAKQLIDSVSEKDRIAVIGLAGDVSYPRDDICVKNTLVPMTFETKFYFTRFIDQLDKQDSHTNHSLGFQKAFQMIGTKLLRGRTQNVVEEAMIIYISRGLLSSLTEARDVLDTIAIQNGRMGYSVVINTYPVIEDGNPIMFEKSFLQDVADQNFSKYDIQPRSSEPVKRGTMVPVNTTRDLSLTVGRFYESLNRSVKDVPVFSLPMTDLADGALTLSISQVVVSREGKAIGVSGVDLQMEDLVQDITYFGQDDGSYAFIINTDGYTIMHPSFTRPIKTNLQPMHTDIWHFENQQGFEAVRMNIIKREEGEQTLMIKPYNSTGMSRFYAKYIWKRVTNTPFIVVIKVLLDNEDIRSLENSRASLPDLVYHRIDVLPASNMCLHLKQLSTSDTSTVFLSANSFQNPFEHLSQEETKRMVQSYVAYLKDVTRLISNPGIKDGVRNDVAATAGINKVWMRRFHVGDLNDYVIRRYVATPSGVFRIFPGTLFDKSFDPTKRPWYESALEFPGHVTLTAPYLDIGGAGYIVTISHTIFEGKPAALHSPSDKIVAVMGMDITLGYFYKMLIDNIPVCSQSTVRCFLVNDKGYMIAHPTLMEPNGKGPVEQQHITHKEPLVANDILNHRHFVKKKLCNSYNDRTVQRFYHFNTSLDGVLTNLVHGEHCARYQVTHIPGTNIFLGITNHTCDTATAFCPCSMVDRLCLNCNRMEQAECECPCECPLAMDFCTGDLLKEEDLNPSCPRYPETVEMVDLNPALTSKLPQCYQPTCDKKKTQIGCLGLIGCDWCQVQEDGTTPLSKPYCASHMTCFGGVLGAKTPYGEKPKGKALSQPPEPPSTKSTPVGPVAGGIMGCFLVLALGVYCYRHHIHRNSHQYISTLPENQNRMSNYYEPEDVDIADEPGAGHTNFVLATFENPASVSPYRVNTSYRRPAGGDSDHGYSTMTPHEDSEHASLPCLEPLLIGKDRYKPGTYSMAKTPILPPPPSVSSRRSRSPTPPQTRLSGYQPIPEQTIIPSQTTILNTVIPEHSHNIIANVQVHMVDTH